MADTQAVLGAVALLIVAVALILALTMVVLLEARWTLGLWAALHRSWNSTSCQLHDADSKKEQVAKRRGEG
jgi:hypothetical protein